MPDAAREASRIAPSGADASISTNATFAASSAVFARRQCGHPLVVTNATTGAEGADDASSERDRRTKRRLGPREPREGRRTPSAATRDEATRPRAPRRRRREGSRGVHRARCAVSGRRDRDEGDDDTSRRVRGKQVRSVIVVSRRRRGVCSTRRDVNSHPALGARLIRRGAPVRARRLDIFARDAKTASRAGYPAMAPRRDDDARLAASSASTSSGDGARW